MQRTNRRPTAVQEEVGRWRCGQGARRRLLLPTANLQSMLIVIEQGQIFVYRRRRESRIPASHTTTASHKQRRPCCRLLEVDPYVAVQIALMAGAVVAHTAHERLLPRVDLHVALQQRLADKRLAAAAASARRPQADVALAMRLAVVLAHVRLAEIRHAAADVRRVEPLVHRGHVSFKIVPTIGFVGTLGVRAGEGLVLTATS